MRDHDSRGRGRYVETLRAYLEISGIDFDDPVQRLVAHLQLHLDGPAGRHG